MKEEKKEERFEKVVEDNYISLHYFALFIALNFFCSGYMISKVINNSFDNLSPIQILVFSVSLFFSVVLVGVVFLSLCDEINNRKVYWRKIE